MSMMRILFSIGLFAMIGSYDLAAQSVKRKTAKVDNAAVSYYDIGKKKSDTALVLVHCWTCNSEFWKENYRAFPEFRVIAMDLPGHGQSDKPKADYSMEFFAKSVNAVMTKAGVKKAVLVGHSMGTPIIRRFYELYPSKTLGLVLVDGALLPYGPREQVEVFFAPMYADYKTNAPKFIDGMLEGKAREHVKGFVRTSMLATPDYVAISAMKSMLDDAYADHGQITVPVLAVMAEDDFWPKDLKEKYAAIAPRIDFRMWKGVSHFLQLEKPSDFNSAVKEFVSANKLLN